MRWSISFIFSRSSSRDTATFVFAEFCWSLLLTFHILIPRFFVSNLLQANSVLQKLCFHPTSIQLMLLMREVSFFISSGCRREEKTLSAGQNRHNLLLEYSSSTRKKNSSCIFNFHSWNAAARKKLNLFLNLCKLTIPQNSMHILLLPLHWSLSAPLHTQMIIFWSFY